MSLKPHLETLFREAFAPTLLEVVDDSAAHAGHAGARGGGGHYQATIVSAAFAGQSRVARHQMVYAVVQGEMKSGAIHALALITRTPEEWAQGLR